MSIYTSRFSNPELRSGNYTAVRISLGTPRWSIGYSLDGELKDLMPFGLMGKYDNDMPAFKREYFARLDRIGVQRILQQLTGFTNFGKDIVLLCYEDVRKGENDWCHRVMFAEWWLNKTGEIIQELPDPTAVSIPKAPKTPKQTPIEEIPANTQLTLF